MSLSPSGLAVIRTGPPAYFILVVYIRWWEKLLQNLVWIFHFSWHSRVEEYVRTMERHRRPRHFNIQVCITWQKQNWHCHTLSVFLMHPVFIIPRLQAILTNAAQFRRKSWDDSPPNGWYCSSEWWVESVPKSSRWIWECNVQAKLAPPET